MITRTKAAFFYSILDLPTPLVHKSQVITPMLENKKLWWTTETINYNKERAFSFWKSHKIIVACWFHFHEYKPETSGAFFLQLDIKSFVCFFFVPHFRFALCWGEPVISCPKDFPYQPFPYPVEGSFPHPDIWQRKINLWDYGIFLCYCEKPWTLAYTEYLMSTWAQHLELQVSTK